MAMALSLAMAIVFCLLVVKCTPSMGEDQAKSIRHDVDVYRKHVSMTFEQNPDTVLDALVAQEQRRKTGKQLKPRGRPRPNVRSQRVVIDQYGRHFVWDERHGRIPVMPLPWDYPVMWFDGPEGPFAVPMGMEPVYPPMERVFLVNPTPDSCDPLRSTSSIQEQNNPMMSFYEPSSDPCTGKRHSEFAVTATSGMADILCMLCQYLKSKRCVWQFCVHPEGVYRINISEHLKT
ncbi:uncharacterized protein LOC110443212 [Mizuhopecten yessoensis]|uniref:uncharacterized protein LOC110443212 n=1 Tax=Mizuhopecten yessoensis TaxID=6573 RepID=UPI000B4575AD|nr:uncharacterized protein LOC110443212 [Mizuhopecten yessoensis]